MKEGRSVERIKELKDVSFHSLSCGDKGNEPWRLSE